MSKKDNKNDNKAFSGGVKETLAQSTDTLWQNEVIANKFVARILIYTAVIALVVLGMSVADIFTINTGTMIRNLGMATAGLVVPAGICMYYKGEKKWLKLLMMLAYIAVLAQLHMVLGHNIVLCLVFPVILSVRYCSWPLTSLVSTLTAVSYLFVSYYGITHGITRMDLNMVEMPPGSILNFRRCMTAPARFPPALCPQITILLSSPCHFSRSSGSLSNKASISSSAAG